MAKSKFKLCSCGGKKIASGILKKDYIEGKIKLSKGTPLFVEILGSDICYNAKYKIHLTIDIDIDIT